MAETPERLTPKEYGARRGVSKTIVNRHISNGRLPKTGEDGRLDVAAADAAWATNVRSNPSNVKAGANKKRQTDGPLEAQAHGGAIQRGKSPQDITPSQNAILLASGVRPQDLPTPPTPVDIQSGEGLVKIRRVINETRVEEGELIERIPVETKAFELARKMRNAGENWVSRNFNSIAADLGVPPHKVRVCLERHMREYHVELAQYDGRSILPRQ